MIIPFFAIPSLNILINAFSVGPSYGKYLQRSCPGSLIQFYSRASFALAVAAKNILNERKKDFGTIWLPDYFCNEALAPTRKMNVNIHFYPIKENLEPDWDNIEREINETAAPDIFMIVHYFGFPNNIERAVMLCERYNIELIEDMAHMLEGAVRPHRSLKIFSPRKLLPLPEVGILVSRDVPPMPPEVQRTKNINVLKWVLICMIKKLLIGLGISWYGFRSRRADAAGVRGIRDDNSVSASLPNGYSLKLLSAIEEEIPKIIEKRRNNYSFLYDRVQGRDDIYPLFPSFPPGACPYVLPLIIDNRQKEVFHEFRLRGIPASTWPDLPPEVESNREEHKAAVRLRNRILLLPVHQGLGERQLSYIADTLKSL
jgi:hypothetical protein